MAVERKTSGYLKRKNHILIERARGGYFKDSTLVKDMFLQLVDFNKELVDTIEKLEKEISELKGESTADKTEKE